MASNTITRNAGAKWAVTSENEWYKAAYYKSGSTNAGYWLYPTSSNFTPGRNLTDTSGNNANYFSYDTNTFLIGSPYYRTTVGQFWNSDSPYGTFDQGGNVWEWNESIIGGTYRGLRGGSYYGAYVNQLSSSYREYSTYLPTSQISSFGFRVSQVAPVPEPSSFIALGALMTPLLAFRRRAGK